MDIGLYEIEIEGVRFKSVVTEGELKNRVVAAVEGIEYGYIFPVQVAGEIHELLVLSNMMERTSKLKTSTGKALHRIAQFAQIIENVSVSNGYLEVPAEIHNTIYNVNAEETFSNHVGFNKDGSIYIDSNSYMFMVGDPTKPTSRPHLELPLLSSYLYLIDDKSMNVPGTFTDIKSEPIPGTPYYINYNLNNVVKIEERIAASKLYYGKFLEHLGINESVVSEYIQDKIKNGAPELIKGIEIMEAEELIESFGHIDSGVRDIARAISQCKNINQHEMKDYIFRYMKHYERADT